MIDLQKQQQQQDTSTMRALFGFELVDFQSWTNFVKLLNRPEDPSSLAALRIMFGILMILDIPQERGMSHVDAIYPNENRDCQFPLFNFLEPLRVEYMIIIYFIMFLSAVGITLGLFYRLTTMCFTIIYWYIFLLDKTTWNNHSYLYGVIGFQLIFVDAHHYWSIDGLFRKKIRNSHVPLWNYTLIRYQIFLVYFIAGLKKTDWDWITGYSMNTLGDHWIFSPFHIFMTIEQITLFLVHICGFLFDLLIGFALFFDRSRPLGLFFCLCFHLMNSQLFSIGMFPYTMIATTPIFFHNNWLREFFNNSTYRWLWKEESLQCNSHCLYKKEEIKAEELKNRSLKLEITKTSSIKNTPNKATFRHKICTIFVLVYLTEQTFLPYSHFITKGYNNWTNGIYGYSWDMMIHSWHTQDIKISFFDKIKQETHYIKPTAWAAASRWSMHTDMIVQHAQCIKAKLKERGYDDIELRFDIWLSLNGRFNQRLIDPHINLLSPEAKWTPMESTPWLKPLLTNLTDCRTRIRQIKNDVTIKDKNTYVTFVADFPGYFLNNYIPPYLNAIIEVLQGQIIVEILSLKKNITLDVGQNISVPSGDNHIVHTVSSIPSCYMYVFSNQSNIQINQLWNQYYNLINHLFNQTIDRNRVLYNDTKKIDLVHLSYDNIFKELQKKTLHEWLELPYNYNLFDENGRNASWTAIRLQFEKRMNQSIIRHLDTMLKWHEKYRKTFETFIDEKMKIFLRCYQLVKLALRSIIYQTDFMEPVEDKIVTDSFEESYPVGILTEESPP